MIRTIKESGFTLVELIIVIVVIAILAAITIVAYNGIQQRAVVASLVSDLDNNNKQLQIYQAQNGAFPVAIDCSSSPVTNSICLKASNGATYTGYTSTNSSGTQTYCLAETNGTTTYFINNNGTTPAVGACTITSELLAWWPFNGNANDISGNAINGTVNGASLTNGQAGVANTAYQLGDSGLWISMGTPSAFANLTSTGFTYSLWVSRTSTATYQWPEIMGAANTHIYYGLRSFNYGDSISFEYGVPPGYTTYSSIGSMIIGSAGVWHLLTVTYSGTSLIVYFDGIQKATTSVVLNPTQSTFGLGQPAGGYGWPGNVDDARVYGRALSASEVQTLYTAGAQ